MSKISLDENRDVLLRVAREPDRLYMYNVGT